MEYFRTSLQRNLQRRNAGFLFADHVGLGQAYEGLREPNNAKVNYEKAITMTEGQREALGEAEKARFFVAEVEGFKRIKPYEGTMNAVIPC